MNSLPAQPRTWDSIQILRGLAALAVVLHHIPHYIDSRKLSSSYTLEAGAAGVDIFFVISGFVMYTTTYGKTPTAKDFFLKRLARILPIYWLLTSALFLATVLAPSAFGSFKATWQDWLKSIFFIPIFDARGFIRPLINQGWTLHFELTFYAILALSLLLAKKHQTLIAAAIVATVSTLATNLTGDLHYSYLQLLAPITLEFCGGVIVAHFFYSKASAHWIAKVAPYSWLPLMLAGLVFFQGGTSAELGYPRVQSWGVGAILLVTGTLMAEDQIKRFGSAASPLKLLGDASYSLYLLHGISFSISWKLIPPEWRQTSSLAELILLFFAIGISIPFHILVEKRLNHLANQMIKS